MRCSSRKPTSNQPTSRSSRSASTIPSSGASLRKRSASARISTRNFTPCGKAVNWVSNLCRGGVSAAREAALRLVPRRWLGRALHIGDGFIQRDFIGRKTIRQHLQEGLLAGIIQTKVEPAERRRPGTRRDLAATGFEAFDEQGAQGVRRLSHRSGRRGPAGRFRRRRQCPRQAPTRLRQAALQQGAGNRDIGKRRQGHPY